MHDPSKPSTGMLQRQLSLPANAWSTSLFMGRQNSKSTTPLQSPGGISTPTTIYIFRLAADSYSTPQPGRSRPMYPLCTSGWCLNRLRTTCNLWAFVRTSIMEKVWEEVSLVASRRTSATEISSASEPGEQQENPAPPPPVPPPRGRFGMLWERASSLGAGVVEKISTTEPEKDRKNEEDAKKLPSPPPEPEESPPKRFVPPPRTQASVPPQSPRNRDRTETSTPPTEEPDPARDDDVLFEHDQHDHPQPAERSLEPPTSLVKLSEPVVGKPRPPVLPPRAPRHPPIDIVRPGTPSAIPLPDSRPSTPPITTVAERRTSLPPRSATPDPGRSSSPAPGPGNAPPPIPRRAPTRVRPARSSTPLNQPPINSLEEKKEEVKDRGADPSITAEEPANSTAERTGPPLVVESINRPEPEITKLVINTEGEPQEPDIKAIRNAQVPSPTTVAEGSANSPVDGVQLANGDGSGFINNRNLVGDKSWQERTWREVVRLREEMFHARMGIVR